MEDMAAAVRTFIRWTDEHPLPPGVSTRVVLRALRAHLDATAPGWRQRVLAADVGTDAVEVEVHLQSGRVMRGTLVQRSSAAA